MSLRMMPMMGTAGNHGMTYPRSRSGRFRRRLMTATFTSRKSSLNMITVPAAMSSIGRVKAPTMMNAEEARIARSGVLNFLEMWLKKSGRL